MVSPGLAATLAVAFLVLALSGCTEPPTVRGFPDPVDASASSSPTESSFEVALVATGVAATNRTPTGALIAWTIAGPSGVQSRVDYGGTNLYGSSTPLVTGTGPKTALLSGLRAGQTYHYRIHIVAGARSVDSLDAVFQTLAAPDETPPLVSNVDVREITPTTARVDWVVSENTGDVLSHVRYGTVMNAYPRRTAEVPGDAAQSAILTGLSPGTRYYFAIFALDAAGNGAQSPDGNFTTVGGSDASAPIVSTPTQTVPTSSSITISWSVTDNSEAVDSRVRYGTATATYTDVTSNLQGTGSKSVSLSGLTPSTDYYYVVEAVDFSNNTATTPEQEFTTAAQGSTNAPPTVFGISQGTTTQNSASISWQVNDESASVQSRLAYGTQQGGPYTERPWRTGAAPPAETLTGLAAGTRYYYVISADDGTNAAVTTSEFDFQTQFPPSSSSSQPPVIDEVSITVSEITKDSFKVTYSVSGPSSTQSKVKWGLGADVAGGESPTQAGTGSKMFTIANLTSKTLYHFQVVATASGEDDVSTDRTQRTAESVVVTITAGTGNAFSPMSLAASGTGLWHVEVTNTHTAPHTWTVKDSSGSTVSTFDTSGIDPGDSDEIIASALAAGSYTYVCTFHSAMNPGTLTVS